MKTKDIPEEPILRFLLEHESEWCMWIIDHERSVRRAMPPGTPDKLVLSKMRSLIRRGLVDGCGCGCRGDFVITEKGKNYLDNPRKSANLLPP